MKETPKERFRAIARGGLLLAAFLFFYAPQTKAQQFELVCPSGSYSVGALQSFDNSTGKYRQNYCIDANGNVTSNQGSSGIPVISLPNSAGTVSVTGGTISIVDATTGTTTTGTDLAATLNTFMNAHSSTCGRIYFRNGTYPINSNTSISGGTYNGTTYGIGIPAAVVAGSKYCEWQFEGEAAPSFLGTSNLTGGVIWDVQSAALPVSTVLFSAVFKLPDTGTVYDATSLVFRNIGVRFPSNQRGCERGIWPREAGQVSYYNVIAWGTTGVLPGALAPVPGTCGMVGLSSTGSLKNQIQYFENTTVSGFDMPYDWSMDHIVANSILSQFNNFAGCFACTIGGFGYSAPVQVSTLTNFDDTQNGAGITIGPGVGYGCRLDIFGYDLEFNTTAWQSRTTPSWVETNNGYCGGTVFYQVYGAGSVINVPFSQFFTSGGIHFQGFDSALNPNLAVTPGVDNFTRPNATNVGPPWLQTNGSGCGITIASNKAVGTAGGNICMFGFQYNPDMFSSITINANAVLNSAIVRGQLGGVSSYYDYACITGTGRELRKRVTGTFTVLGGPTGSCSAGDVLELRVIGSNFWAYYTHSGVTTLDFLASDSTFTSGFPGMAFGGATDSISSWSGGSFPTFHGVDSLFNNPTYHTSYNTVTNCAVNSASPAACGSAASGVFAIPAAQTTYTVNTTALNSASRIFLQPTTDNTGIPSAPTCADPALTAATAISSRVAGTSFTIQLTSNAGITCYNYWIIN